MGIVRIVFSQLFSITQSCGSLIQEILNLFRIFQRLSATKTFYSKFSSDCADMFSWATNIIKIITQNIFPDDHLTTYEYFTIYSIYFYIFLINFTTFILIGAKYVYLIPFFAIIAMFGAGFGFIGIDEVKTIYFCVFGGIIILAVILRDICECSLCDWPCCIFFSIRPIIEGDLEPFEYISLVIFGGIIISAVTFSPIIIDSSELGIIVILLMAIIIVLAAIYEFLNYCCSSCCCCEKCKCCQKDGIQHGLNLIQLLISLIPLLLIPATENFVAVLNSFHGVRWCTVLSYVIFTLCIPIVMTIDFIVNDNEDFQQKYKDINFCSCAFFPYQWLELVDLIHQVVYAFLASYDIPLGCLLLEIFWSITIILIRPYNQYSQFWLKFGESLVMIISNSVAIHAERVGTQVFSFELSIILVAIACIPVVSALYLFFIFDFKFTDEGSKETKFKNETKIMAILFIFVSPVTWFLFGTNIPFIYSIVTST